VSGTDDGSPTGARQRRSRSSAAVASPADPARDDALGLIDEYRVRVYPVLVGGGIPFFAQRERGVDLGLVETRTLSASVIYLHRRVAR
jgi:hypothetical protein